MNIHSLFNKNIQNLKDYDSFYIILLCALFVLFCVPFAALFKFHDPYTTIKWVITLLSINFCVFIFLIKSKKLTLPRLPNILLYIIGLILFFIVINSYIHNVPLISYENMRRFVFWGGAVLFFNLFCSQKEEGFNKIEKAISLSAAAFLLPVLTQYILYPAERPYLTFGNINLSVEFIVFSLAFQLGFLVRLWKDGKKSIFFNIIASLSLTYIYFAYCRSAYICVILMLISIIYFYKNVWKEILKLIVLSIFFIFSVKAILFFLYPNEIIPIGKNLSIRWLLYLNTLKMIMENPLGVGVGQYEFASIPYMGELFPYFNEALIFLSPHDEVLHFLAEDGLILSFFFFLLGASCLCFFWKDIKNAFRVYPEFLCFSIILFVQSLFQFPLIEPLPYFMTAIMVGYFFSVIKTDHMTFVLTRGLKFVLLSANLLAFIIFVTYFSSKYIAFNFSHDEKLNKIACSFGSRNWLACLNVASSNLDKGDYDTAESYALRTLDWQPFNYQGMKALGFSLLYQGNTRKACKIFNEYDAFFGNQSSIHHLINRECQGLPLRRS